MKDISIYASGKAKQRQGLALMCGLGLACVLLTVYGIYVVWNALRCEVAIAPLSLLSYVVLWSMLLGGCLIFRYRYYLPGAKMLARLGQMKQSPALPSETSDLGDAVCKIIDMYEAAFEQEYTTRLLQKQAELDMLQSQINPHFLYNTLDSIRGQALEDGSRGTADMIEVLSRLLRYTISQHGDLCSLDQELVSVKNYMRIQQYRFENRFTFHMTYDAERPELLEYKIPKLSLQPIVENAIYHGLEEKKEGGEIEIRIEETVKRLVISILDNGLGMTQAQLNRLNHRLQLNMYETIIDETKGTHSGIAVSNVNKRIQLLYGNDYGVHVYSTLGIGTKVELSLPKLEDAHEKRSVTTG